MLNELELGIAAESSNILNVSAGSLNIIDGEKRFGVIRVGVSFAGFSLIVLDSEMRSEASGALVELWAVKKDAYDWLTGCL
ncbi:UNVERIFIED_CONTAM: hypothetical protein ACS92_03465 [Bacillus cereus]